MQGDASEPTIVRWLDRSGIAQRAAWQPPWTPPRTLTAVDERLTADSALRRLRSGEGLVWEGDYHQARQVLAAVTRRLDRTVSRRSANTGPRPAGDATITGSGGRPALAAGGPPGGAEAPPPATEEPGDVGGPGVVEDPAEVAVRFHRHRARQGERARTLQRLLVVLDPGYRVRAARAPSVTEACRAAWGPSPEAPFVVSLRDLLGVVGAHQWEVRGIEMPAAGGLVHPRYGVFAPVRAEYVDLVAAAPLPGTDLAVDVGTGTGVLAAVLARRSMRRVVATDVSPAALACARENLDRLGVGERCDVVGADLFAPGVRDADVVVCNPPWLPGKPTSELEGAVYDSGSAMLRGFLAGAAGVLRPGGEAWLLLSDLAERLGLRSRAQLETWFDEGGLAVAGRLDTRPRHRRAADAADPFHRQRSAEITSLWRLVPR